MARAAPLLTASAALCLSLCCPLDAFWLPAWASWTKKPEATAYSVGSYPAPVEPSPAQQYSGPGPYGVGVGGGALPLAVAYPVPVAAGPHLQMPASPGQLSLSGYSVAASAGGIGGVNGNVNGNGVSSDVGVGGGVGGVQLVPCWCSVAGAEAGDAPGGPAQAAAPPPAN